MLQILRDNNSALGLSATQTQFDTVINRTLRQLQQQTLDLTLSFEGRANDTAYYSLALKNKAGHKFPAGYPSRRAFVEFLVLDDNNDTVFYSGRHDNQYRLLDEDSTYEPHYDVINSPNQVQIYEMVMGDVNNNVTTVLERANIHLKDNRIPPVGFTTTHLSYDTAKIVGNAFTDANFNKSNNVEGTGVDSLYYHIPLNGYAGTLKVYAKVYYQPVPPRYLDDMFQYSSQEIDLFRNLYQAADYTPVIVAQDSTIDFPTKVIANKDEIMVEVYPNPTSDKIYVTSKNINSIQIYSSTGKLIYKYKNITALSTIVIDISNYPEGVYFVTAQSTAGKHYVSKIVKKK